MSQFSVVHLLDIEMNEAQENLSRKADESKCSIVLHPTNSCSKNESEFTFNSQLHSKDTNMHVVDLLQETARLEKKKDTN